MTAPRTVAPEPCPGWLSGDARGEWDRVAAILCRARRRYDAQVLERHATAYAAWREAEAEIAASGRVITLRDDKGLVRAVQPSPWVVIGEKARAEMARTTRLLGL